MKKMMLLVLVGLTVGCAKMGYRYLGIPDNRTYPSNWHRSDRNVLDREYYRISEVTLVDRQEYLSAARHKGLKYVETHGEFIYFSIETRVLAERVPGIREWVTVLERRKTPVDPDAVGVNAVGVGSM